MASGGGSSSPNQTVTQTQQLPAYAQGTAQSLLDQATALSQKQYSPYQGQQIADLNPLQQAGIANTASQATYGFQGQPDVMNQYQDTVRGDYLNPASNPYLTGAVNSANDSITRAYKNTIAPQADAAAVMSGAFGGSAAAENIQNNQRTLADSLSNADNNLYAQNYNNERTNQVNAVNNAGNMQALGYNDSTKLESAGDIQRQYQQDLLNQGLGAYQGAQNQPYANMDVLAKGLSAAVGNSSQSFTTSPNPYQASPYASLLGGGLAAGGLVQGLLGSKS